jgi:hypothetical protein
MNPRLRPDYLAPFNKVADIICRTDPPSWLAEQFWRWNRFLYQDRMVEKTRPSRVKMRATLAEVEEAASCVTEALGPSWVREFLDASGDGPLDDTERLIATLENLQYRAFQAQNSPDLATKTGVTKPGPGKARPGGCRLGRCAPS